MASSVDSMKDKIRSAQRKFENDLKALERDARLVEEHLERVIQRLSQKKEFSSHTR